MRLSKNQKFLVRVEENPMKIIVLKLKFIMDVFVGCGKRLIVYGFVFWKGFVRIGFGDFGKLGFGLRKSEKNEKNVLGLFIFQNLEHHVAT